MEQTEEQIAQEKEAQEKAEQEKQVEYDKQQQMIDQERANARKAREEAEAYATALEEANTEKGKLEAKIAEQTQKVQSEQDKLDAMDPDLVDRNIIKNFEKTESKLQKLEKAYDDLQLKAKAYEEAETKREAQVRKEATIGKILDPLDQEFGAKYRNDARKLADDWVDTKKEKQPQDPIDAMILMRKAYLEVSKKADSETPVPTDGGKGGIAIGESKGKPGTYADVIKEMKERGAFKPTPGD